MQKTKPAGKIPNAAASLGTSLTVPEKLNRITTRYSNSTPGTFPRAMKTYLHKKLTQMFTAAEFVRPKKWEKTNIHQVMST